MAAAKEINTDAAAEALLSGPGGIFTVKETRKRKTTPETTLKVFKCGQRRFLSRANLNAALVH